MEFNSPRPEHAQLQGQGTVVHPKGTSTLLSSLNERILNGSRSGTASAASNTTEQSGTIGSRDVILGNGFTLLAPLPLNTRDSVLHESVDEYLIPSPPLSPKEPENSQQLRLLPPLPRDGAPVARDNDHASNMKKNVESEASPDGIMVKGAWDNYQGPHGARRYQLYVNAFLSQYRVLKPKISKYSGNNSSSVPGSRYSRRTRTPNRTYASNSDFEKVYRTRRATGGNTSGKNVDSSEEMPSSISYVPRRPATPVSRRKPATHHSSPLSHSSTAARHHDSSHQHHTVNMSWEKLPDYSPSLETLPTNNNKCLKVDWKGSSMDLSHDPLKNKLHPAELVLAQILRLPCDLYLDSKRRFFMEKVHRLKQGMPFRRTDAQKACRIDVNKASRLFAAFEKVGWLQDLHFKKFL